MPTPNNPKPKKKNKRKIKNSNVSRFTRMRKRSSNKLDNLDGGSDGDKHVIGRVKSKRNNMPLLMGHIIPPFKPVIVKSPTADERLDDLAKEHIQRQGRT